MHRVYTLLLAATVLCVSVGAQTATGILQGRVIDATGSAVPGAKVAIENETTGVALALVTNGEGNFFRSFLLPGNYRVTVEKDGFQQKVTSGVRVDVQQTVSLEIALKVGDVTNTVEVQASAVQLASATSSVSTVIGNKMIQDLPLNGRNPFSLATLTPGVIPTSGTSLPWISGGRNASSEITIDARRDGQPARIGLRLPAQQQAGFEYLEQ
jgi:carboxypeptidase family protein